MRSTSGANTPSKRRSAWQAPAMTELPVHTATRVGSGPGGTAQASEPPCPPPASCPQTKLGFSFEMSLPLSVRTE
jgi:hypothetical protein